MTDRLAEWLEAKETTSIGFTDPGLETCSQIAGSNQWVVDAFTTPGLGCHLLSFPHHGVKAGGDIHYVTVCGYGMKSKFLLINARGLDRAATQLSTRLLEPLGRLAGKPDNQSILSEINTLIYHADYLPALATVAAATFNDAESTWTYAYAGHPNMLIRRDENWSELRAEGDNTLPAGMLRESGYYQTTTTLQPGDWVMMYSNGVLNAVSHGKASHALSGLLELASSVDATTTEAFFPEFTKRLVDINHGADFNDDLTLILIDRK